MSGTGPGHAHHRRERRPFSVPRGPRVVLAVLTGLLLVATVVGLVVLWPTGAERVDTSQHLAEGVEIVPVTVTEAEIDGRPSETVLVGAVGRAAPYDGTSVQVDVPPEVAADGIQVGDRLRVLSLAESAQGEAATGGGAESVPLLYYFDHERTLPLAVLLVAYLLLVALVARGNGLRAMVGLAAGVAIVLWFMLPAIFAGENAVLVALVAASAMIFPCVYFAHGISVRTTTAVLGTFGGIAVTVALALLGGGPTGMTGTDGEAAQMLYGTYPQLSMPAVFLAGVII